MTQFAQSTAPDADLCFFGSRSRRKNGLVEGLFCTGDLAHSWTANSGPWKNGALPCGIYRAHGYHHRADAPHVKFGIGFSVELKPLFATTRSFLQIHPDGNKVGTLGCIGITDPDVAACSRYLRRLLETKEKVLVQVQWE